jgi:hypothetical protein
MADTNTKPDRIFSLRLSAPLHAALGKAAARDGRTISNFIRVVLIDRLARDGIRVAPGGESRP